MFDFRRIITFLKKNFNKKDLFFILVIFSLYWLTRLVNLELLPIFADEGIYIRWAKTAWRDASWRFISLTDGRQPFQTWATIPLLKLFPQNPLLAGRLFGVVSGFFGVTAIYILLFYLWGKKAAYLGSILYIFSPFQLLYQRMALADSAVNTFFLLSLLFSLFLAKSPRLDLSLIFGLISGLSLLTKSTNQLFLISSFFAPIIFFKKLNKEFIVKLINFSMLFFFSLILALAIYNVQRLSPFMHFIGQKNLTFVLSFEEWLKNPFLLVRDNIKVIPYYLAVETGFLMLITGLIGILLLFKKNARLGLYFFIWFLMPFLVMVFFSKVIFPRYLIFFNSLIIILTTFFLIEITKKKVFLLIFGVIILNLIAFGYPIIFKPEKMILPEIDRGQYLTGTTAGFGVREIINHARSLAEKKPVIILAEGDFGVIGDQLEALLIPSDKIFIKGYWPLDYQNLKENQSLVSKYNVLVVFSHRQKFPQDWPIKLIKKYEKPENQTANFLFELTK